MATKETAKAKPAGKATSKKSAKSRAKKVPPPDRSDKFTWKPGDVVPEKPKAKAKSKVKSATKAKKTAKVKKAKTKDRHSRALGDFANDHKITVLARSNPHATGTMAAKRFACLKTGMTVGAALDAMKAKKLKGRRGSLRRDRKAGHIQIGRKG